MEILLWQAAFILVISGLPINHKDKFAIYNKSTALRSIASSKFYTVETVGDFGPVLILSGEPDPRIMVNSNKSPCTALSKDSQIYKTSDQGSTVLLCTCYQIHYNINGTKQKNLTVLAVTAEWVDGASVDTTLRIAEARICHPRKCCDAPSLRLKREDAGDDSGESQDDLRAGKGKTSSKSKGKSGKGLSGAAIGGIVAAVILIPAAIACGILGCCYYKYKQELKRIRLRNKIIEKNNQKLAERKKIKLALRKAEERRRQRRKREPAKPRSRSRPRSRRR